MISSRSLLGAAMAKLTADRRTPPNPSVILIVEHRNDFFASLAAELKSDDFQVERAASAAEATQGVRRESPDLILANCELPDESGWLMVSKWCLTRMPKRVWLYQAWPAVFDQNWVEFTKVERILYHGDDALSLADQVRHHLGRHIASERRRSQSTA